MQPLKWAILSVGLLLAACNSVVLVDREPPSITVSSADTVTTASYRLTGTLKDNFEVKFATYQLNGGPAEPLVFNAAGEFQANLSLQPGENTILVLARDEQLNTQQLLFRVQFQPPQTVLPTITFTSLPVAGTASYTFTGTVTDDVQVVGATYQLNGGAVLSLPLDSSGHFSVPLTLNPGTNTLVVVARDQGGARSAAFKVERVEQPPTLSSLFPAQGIEAGGAVVTLKGTNLKGATSVKFGGVEAQFQVQPYGDLTVVSPPHVRGDAQVTVTTPLGTSNALTFKYVPFGVWQFGSNQDDVFGGLDVDVQENFYVAMTLSGRSRVRKHDSKGKVLWEWLAPPETKASLLSRKLALDSQNNVYLYGTLTGAYPGTQDLGTRDDFLAKLNSQGQFLWIKRMNLKVDPLSVHLKVDPQSNIYVAGNTPGSPNSAVSTVLTRYSPDGTELWRRELGGNPNFYSHDLVLDRQGNPHVLGTRREVGSSNTPGDMFISKFDPTGQNQWMINDPKGHLTEAVSMVFNSKNEAFVLCGPYFEGWSYGLLVKYSSTGLEINRKSMALNRWYVSPVRMLADDADHLYILTSGTLAKLAPDGTPLERKAFYWSGVGAMPDLGGMVAVAPSGNLYVGSSTHESVAGYVNPSAATTDILLRKYNSNLELFQ